MIIRRQSPALPPDVLYTENDGKSGVLMQRHYKNAAFLTTAMVAVVLALRAWITPHMLDRQDDLYRLSYVVIAVMALTILGVLIWTGLRRQEPLQVSGLWLKPAAVLGMLAGAALVLTCLFDAWNWLLGHTPPAPAVETVGVAGGVVLGLSLLFGLAGGAFLFRIGLLWLEEDGSRPGVYRLWALCPVLWIWMRLARYEMSYVSAIDVYRSFYDFVMLIFIMLFFLFFARFAAGVGNPRPRLLVGVSLSAALCALTGPATHFIMFAMGNPDAAEACALATPVDFCIGLFALAFAYAQAYGRPYAPQPAEPEPDPPAEPERAEEAVSAPEIPPVPESQWTRTEIPVDPQPQKQPDVEAILKDYSSKTE